MKLRENTADIILYSGLYLSLVTLTVLIFNSLMFLSVITVKPMFLPICMFLSACMYFYFVREKNIHHRIYGILLALAVFSAFIFICGGVFDLSYDGNWYQKASLGSLAHGWNPLYTSLSDFAAMKDGVGIGNLAESAIWADHYCKAAWIFGADIYSFTGNIECAKAVNPTFTYILFSVMYRYLSAKGLPLVAVSVLSLVTALNPISIPQMFTFYNDGVLASALFTVIVLLVWFSDEKCNECDDVHIRSVLLFSSLVFLINIKFTGLAYAGFFCLAFYLLALVRAALRNSFKRTFIRATLFYVLVLFTAVIFVGSSSYVKNTAEHGHPLYPLFGADKTDIMTKNQPDEFSDMTNAEKLYSSLFSQTSNPMGDTELLPKEPFSIDPYEIYISKNSPDTRIGGMGVFFSGILVVSLAALVMILIYLAMRHRNGFLTAITLVIPSVCLILLISESWWARYSPYMWLLPVGVSAVLIYIAKEMNIFARIPTDLLTVFLTVMCLINNGICALYPLSAIGCSEKIHRELTYLSYISQTEHMEIRFPNYAFYGIEYNLKDHDVNYKVVAEFENAGTAFYEGRAEYRKTP